MNPTKRKQPTSTAFQLPHLPSPHHQNQTPPLQTSPPLMEDYYRSKSYAYGRNNHNNNNMYLDNNYTNPTSTSSTHFSTHGFQDFRSYSASYVEQHNTSISNISSNNNTHHHQQVPRVVKKGKSGNGSLSSKAAWCFSDPELQRKKRVASYKAFTVETKIKRSFSKSFRWIKDRYSQIIHD